MTQIECSQKLEGLIKKFIPSVDFKKSLKDQIDSIQVAFLLDEIEKEFSIKFPSMMLVLINPFTFEKLNSVVFDTVQKSQK